MRFHHLLDASHGQQVKGRAVQVGAEVAVHVHPVVSGGRKHLSLLIQFGVVFAHGVLSNLEGKYRERCFNLLGIIQLVLTPPVHNVGIYKEMFRN